MISKLDVLNGLRQSSAYLERNIQTHQLFKREYEISKTINRILEEKENLTQSKVANILDLLNDLDKAEHYDGSGWFDYKIRLAHYLRLSGFEA